MQQDDKDTAPNNKPADQTTDTRKSQDENVAAAHEQAEADIEQDADLTGEPDPSADLDEGEIAALDNNNDDNPMV